MSIPKLRNGLLPPGVHLATLDEIEKAFGVQNERRRHLMTSLHYVVRMFKKAGVEFVLVDGSFISAKDTPADIDGCWSASGNVDLEKIDRDFWDFESVDEFKEKRRIVKERYGLDFFIAEFVEGSTGKQFSEFFQSDRDGFAKGIIKVILT